MFRLELVKMEEVSAQKGAKLPQLIVLYYLQSGKGKK